ncbi:histamine H2 receptor-like [Oculina patagonica]
MNHSTNETAETEVCVFDLGFRIPISILFVVTFLLSVAENIVVSVAISVDKRLRRPSNGYLLSLALTDICISLGLIPLEMTYVWSYPEWSLGSLGTNILNSIWLFSIASSFVTLLVVTVDRFKAVMSLVRYREVVSWGRTLVIIALVWLYAVFVVVLMRVFAFDRTSGAKYEWNVNYKFYYAFLAVHIVLSLLIICALYYKIYKKAVENRQQVLSRGQTHPGTPGATDTVRETRLEVKMAKTVGFVFMFLVIVWIPVLILEIFYAIGSESCIIEQLGVVSVWLTCSNGMMNPVVYSLRNKDFRRAILQLVHCKRPRSASALAQ